MQGARRGGGRLVAFGGNNWATWGVEGISTDWGEKRMGKARKAGLAVGIALAALVVVGVLAPLPKAQVAAAAEMATPGSLHVVAKPGEKLRTCPLEHTDVEGWIVGDVAHVRVTQRFGNPYEEPIEAVYVFPLPENSAVNDMVMQIGTRTIRGVIKEREEAREIYEEAKRAGKTASLLEQERPNIFTQSVANIMPGDAIEITIWYVQDLQYDRGRYEFAFPMVVGPRYIPGAPLPGADSGGGWASDTDQVPDASRITPQVLRPEERTGHDISLALHLDAGVPAYDVGSKSHEAVVESYEGQPLNISLSPRDTLPNKDFSLSWRVAGEKPEVGVLAHRDERSGYFTLILQPKANFDPAEITPKEMVFCLDTSGSMSGVPIEKSKEVVKLCLAEMGRDDTFQVIRFSGDSATFAPEPVRATRANIAEALEFIEQMQGGGGTEMLKGIEESLAFPADPRRVRIVAFLTDGYVGNESEILARIEEKLGTARIFSFGIGSSVNRYLLVKMAQMGRGVAQFVRQDEDPDEAVRRFVDRTCRPYLTDIEIDWGGLDVWDVYPPYVPDLFADQPVVLHGRYEAAGSGTVTIRGTVAGEAWETSLPVTFPAEEEENEALAVLWARASIEDMTDQMHAGEVEELKEAIIELAIAYRLMSPYTSFVAVEEKVVNRDGKLVTVQVPAPMPEDVSYEGVFGPAGAAGPATTLSVGRVAVRGGMGGGGAGGARAGRMGGGARGGGGYAMAGAAQTLYRRAPMLGDLFSEAYGAMAASPATAWMALAGMDASEASARTLVNLKTAAQGEIGLPAGDLVVLEPERVEEIGDAPNLRVLIIAGSNQLALSDAARERLASYVRRGGFVIVDSGGGESHEWMVKLLREVLPEAGLARVPLDHPVFRGEAMPHRMARGCPVVEGLGTAGPAQGLFLEDRLAVFMSRGNLMGAWAQPRGGDNEEAYQMGVNLIAYGLQNAPAPGD
jgi:Ca-activated chloride channel family protein